MKCPKCSYLGFETGDRCKNCGYDFSLLSVAGDSDPSDFASGASWGEDVYVVDGEEHPADLWLDNPRDPLRGRDGPEENPRDSVDDALTISLTPDSALLEECLTSPIEFDHEELAARSDSPDALDAARDEPFVVTPQIAPVVPFAPAAAESALPLFTPEDDDDEPLVRLPAAPRAPLAVRRTPDTPRLRSVPRPTSRPSPAPVLQFLEEPLAEPAPAVEAPPRPWRARAGATSEDASRPGARLGAAAIDYSILVGIDVCVWYFTVRMADLSTSEWRLVPVAPMLTFFALLAVSYFFALTAVGGQTIGKMVVGTCVVADDGELVDAACAMRRTCAGALSFLTLGLGFLPALFGDHRALHDRLAGTRVVRLRSV